MDVVAGIGGIGSYGRKDDRRRVKDGELFDYGLPI